jgi:hypothetical protein
MEEPRAAPGSDHPAPLSSYLLPVSRCRGVSISAEPRRGVRADEINWTAEKACSAPPVPVCEVNAKRRPELLPRPPRRGQNGCNVYRNIPEPEENRKQAFATAYACEIFLLIKPLTARRVPCIILPSAARRSSRGRPGAAPANRKGSWHTRKRLDGLRLVGGTDWRVGRRTLPLHHVGGRKPVARGPKEPDDESGDRASPEAVVSPEARKNDPSRRTTEQWSGARRKPGAALFVYPGFYGPAVLVLD